MSIESENILWNKNIVTAGNIGNSEIGANPITNGTMTAQAIKFGNGSKSNSILNYPIYDAIDFPPNTGMVEFHGETDWSTDGMAASDGQFHGFWNWDKNASAPHNMINIWHHATLGMFLDVWVGGVNTQFQLNMSSGWAASTPFWFLVAFNNGKLLSDGTNTVEAYINGLLVASSAVIVGSMVADANSKYYTHGYHYNITAHAWELDGGLSNLKITGDATDALILEAIANMNNEGWPSVLKRNIATKYNFKELGGLICR